jgi:hypothetical protein
MLTSRDRRQLLPCPLPLPVVGVATLEITTAVPPLPFPLLPLLPFPWF